MARMTSVSKSIPAFKPTISQQFHEATKIRKGTKLKPYDQWPESWTKVYFKSYPRLPAIKLPDPKIDKEFSLNKALFMRQSIRKFTTSPLTTADISNLLYFSCGIRDKNETWVGNRFYPSAGARYPLEVYPIILNSNEFKTGVYHYYLKGHALEELYTDPAVKKDALHSFSGPAMKDPGMILAISAVFLRNQIKYTQRGYRHILVEAGHMCQNIYLLCSVFGLGCCSSGGFIDDNFNKLIDLDGRLESVISVVFIGKYKWKC